MATFSTYTGTNCTSSTRVKSTRGFYTVGPCFQNTENVLIFDTVTKYVRLSCTDNGWHSHPNGYVRVISYGNDAACSKEIPRLSQVYRLNAYCFLTSNHLGRDHGIPGGVVTKDACSADFTRLCATLCSCRSVPEYINCFYRNQFLFSHSCAADMQDTIASMNHEQLRARIQKYPGYHSWGAGGLHVTGRVIVQSLGDRTNQRGHGVSGVKVRLSYSLCGVEANPSVVVGTELKTGGIHIHQGTTCQHRWQVGGHFSRVDPAVGTTLDPWRYQDYTPLHPTNPTCIGLCGHQSGINGPGCAIGNFTIDAGYATGADYGHAVVVHSSNGTRVGCGILEHDDAH